MTSGDHKDLRAPRRTSPMLPPDSAGEPVLPPLDPLADGIEIDLDAPAPVEIDGVMIAELPDGGAEIDLAPASPDQFTVPPTDHGVNLANWLPDDQMQRVAAELLEGIDTDKTSRQEWEDQCAEGLKLMGFTSEDRTFPFNGASGVYDPLMAEAVLRMQSIFYGEMLPPNGPVKSHITGVATDDLQKQAFRVATWMNYYLTQGAPEYYTETDQMYWWLPLVGSAFKKVYQDPIFKRPMAPFVMPADLIVPYTATSLATAARVSNLIKPLPREVKLRQLAGFYRDVALGQPNSLTPDSSAPLQTEVDAATGVRPAVDDKSATYNLYEVQCFADFEAHDPLATEKGLPVPYLVTLDSESQKVLAIYRNWRASDPLMQRRNIYAHYKFFPGSGFYGAGYAHILGGLAKNATTNRRQLNDSGTLNNFPGGVRVKGMRMDDNNLRIGPMEFVEIDTAGMPVQQALMTMPYKEPSQVLFNLLQDSRKAGRDLAGMAEIAVGDGRQDAPVGTTMALLEQATKLQAATVKRAHKSFGEELQMIQELFAEHLPDQPYPYFVGGTEQIIMRRDFDNRVSIVPVSDPNITSQAQRLLRAQLLKQNAASAPEMHDLREAFKQEYIAIGLDQGEIDRLLPPPQSGVPMDPLSENQNAILGKPLKAAPYQDHAAHIAAHMPLAQQTPAMKAHIAEHIAMQMRVQIESLIGRPLPQGPMPPEMENQIAVMVAQATKALEQEQDKPLTAEQLLQAQIQVEGEKIAQRDRQANLQAQVDSFRATTDLERERIKATAQEKVARLRAFGETADNTSEPLPIFLSLMKGMPPFSNGGVNGQQKE